MRAGQAANAGSRLAGMGNLPRVPYQEPEPWVPSGGFEQFRSPEERKRDAEEAARREAEIAQGADDEPGGQS